MTGSKLPPIEYMARTREWYLALGYDNPYQWAHHDDVPFSALGKPINQATVALVTTAAPYQPDKAAQGPGAAYNGEAKFFSVWSKPVTPAPDVRISHIAYDRKHTSAKDANCWFPLRELKDAAARGDIGAIAPRVHGFPTNRSQRTNLEVDAPALLAALRKDGADAAILVPNCPVCPPIGQPCRPPSRGQRHRHCHHGLCEGHRGALRCTAVCVFRLPARQRRRPAF
jgi:D-proline reductase (dithiol) PrdB